MKLTWICGAAAVGALVLASFAAPLHGQPPEVPAQNPAQPQVEDPCDDEHPCNPIPAGAHTYTLQPHGGDGCGDCIITPDGRRVRNTGSATIKVKTGADGEITEIDLGESGEASYIGNGGDFRVTGGGSCSFDCTGDYNTVEVEMGGPSGGGDCYFFGNENSVTNVNNNSPPTTFTSWPDEGEHNDIHLGGETSSMSGPWVYF